LNFILQNKKLIDCHEKILTKQNYVE